MQTILVVDDDPSVLDLVVEILRRQGFHVLSAKCAADAIQLAGANEQRIDLLLSDIEMPAMSGPDLGQLLKKSRPDLHVMLMSGGG